MRRICFSFLSHMYMFGFNIHIHDSLVLISAGKPVPEKLTAKVGTLARKRQLRDILEQQDDGYEDDLFDSTPFRNQGLIKVSGR